MRSRNLNPCIHWKYHEALVELSNFWPLLLAYLDKVEECNKTTTKCWSRCEAKCK